MLLRENNRVKGQNRIEEEEEEEAREEIKHRNRLELVDTFSRVFEGL